MPGASVFIKGVRLSPLQEPAYAGVFGTMLSGNTPGFPTNVGGIHLPSSTLQAWVTPGLTGQVKVQTFNHSKFPLHNCYWLPGLECF